MSSQRSLQSWFQRHRRGGADPSITLAGKSKGPARTVVAATVTTVTVTVTAEKVIATVVTIIATVVAAVATAVAIDATC